MEVKSQVMEKKLLVKDMLQKVGTTIELQATDGGYIIKMDSSRRRKKITRNYISISRDILKS